MSNGRWAVVGVALAVFSSWVPSSPHAATAAAWIMTTVLGVGWWFSRRRRLQRDAMERARRVREDFLGDDALSGEPTIRTSAQSWL